MDPGPSGSEGARGEGLVVEGWEGLGREGLGKCEGAREVRGWWKAGMECRGEGGCEGGMDVEGGREHLG
jgi:hypothetical protein